MYVILNIARLVSMCQNVGPLQVVLLVSATMLLALIVPCTAIPRILITCLRCGIQYVEETGQKLRNEIINTHRNRLRKWSALYLYQYFKGIVKCF